MVGLLFAAGTAEAKIKVAVVAFDGDDKGNVQEVVTDLLDGDYEVAATKTVNRTVDKLGFDANLSDKDLKKLANELEVDAILRGDLSEKGKRKLLHVKLYVNGKKVRGFKVEFASMKSENFRTKLKDKIDEKLAGQDKKKKVEEAAEPASDTEDPIAGNKKTKKLTKAEKAAEKAEKEKAEKAEKGDKKSKEMTADAEDPTKAEGEGDKEKSDEEQSGDEDDPDRKKATKKTASADIEGEGISSSVEVGSKSSSGRTPNLAAVRVDLGASASSRTLAFNSRAFEEAPKPYKNKPVGGFRIGGELYPLAFGNPHSFLSGIGLGGHYDKTLKLNLTSTAQPGTQFPVAQANWSVGLRFRVAIGSSARAPTVTLGGGYFQRSFTVDRSALEMDNIIDLPDVVYKGFDPGLDIRVPIIKQVAFVVGAKAGLITDTGQIQALNQYGRAKVTGGEGMAGIDVVIADRFAVRIVGELAQYGFKFVGNGELTYNRDNVPTTPDVGGAADRYYGGSATLGVLY